MIHLLALAPVSGTRVAEQAAKTVVVVVVLLAGFRLVGKRGLAQFNVYDLAMIMALSNAVQNAMTGGLGNLPIGLATSSTVLLVTWLLARLLARDTALERHILGSPTVLVNRGQVLAAHLRRQRVTEGQLDEACREHGVRGPEDCRLVVLEVDGSLSVVPAPDATRRRPRDVPPPVG
ncbi:MAG TPA: YetF domain-containing protein [Acidimicrobiia bacterium]|nr:YetF domain-containing protein [Acidimicrobiia bacterium]